ncbi:MAG TPA: glycosyltransferase family 4 protein [Geobacteraceae bacterium]|nr:glycosyltransferase family 4 protein [Geobacteraceae bacterium]
MRCVIRVGVITYDFFPLIGGIGRLTYTLYCELQGKDLLFFSPARNSLSNHICVKFWAIRFFKQMGVSLWLFFNARRIIDSYRLAKLNIHAGPGGVLLLRPVPVPVVVTCHHTYWQQYTFIRSQFWKRIFLPFEKKTYQLADAIISDCEDTKRVLIEQYDVPAEKVSVIHCAVDTGKFYFTNLSKKQNCLLYLGRISKRKGIEFLIRSMPLVVQQVADARLLVGGKGECLEKMKSLVSRLGLERNVTFLGFVPDDQLNELYNQVQCVVVPSIFEGFGITVIEALAAGTRVVGTDVDGIREILRSGDYGRLAAYGDHRALAEAIVAELRTPSRAGELRPEYRLEQFRERYLKVLEA